MKSTSSTEFVEKLRELCAKNADVAYANEKAALITYEPRHVPRYHEWMENAETREMTCSERMTIDEEHETRTSWAKHEYCGTFLIMDAAEFVQTGGSELDSLVGDVNFVQYADYVELLIMIGDTKFRRRGLAQAAVEMMIGHVCSFLGSRRVQANILPKNIACIRLLQRIGFERAEDVEGAPAEDVIMILEEGAKQRLAEATKTLPYCDEELIHRLVERSRKYGEQFDSASGAEEVDASEVTAAAS